MTDLLCLKFRKTTRKAVSVALLLTFGLSMGITPAGAQLPPVGQMVWLTPGFQPPVLRGMTVHAENPLLFDFIVDRGQDNLNNDLLKGESEKLIKYFLASMTIPDKDAWVNLSPYEKDRIIPDALGQTEMGKVMLEQDYLLKQLAASLTNPETALGKQYWQKIDAVIARSPEGTTKQSMNKVWIMPDTATVVEKDGFAYITESKLKVMLDVDYNSAIANPSRNDISTQVFRELILPKLVIEVNEGKTFAQTRQVYQSVILAAWYKKALKDSLLGRIYADKSKIEGIESDDKDIKQKVYDQYLDAFKKGAYNVIKEEGADAIPRKYFSGGLNWELDVNIDRSSSAVNRTAIAINNAGDQIALVSSGAAETREEVAIRSSSSAVVSPATLKRISDIYKEVFTQLAPEYLDAYGQPLSGSNEFGIFLPSSLESVQDILSELKIKPGHTFVDFGSGDGRVAVLAALLGAKAVGVEKDPQLVVVATEALKQIRSEGIVPVGTIELVGGGIENYSLQGPNAPDFVYYYQGTGPVADQIVKDKIMAGTTNPNAILVVTGFSSDYDLFPELARITDQAFEEKHWAAAYRIPVAASSALTPEDYKRNYIILGILEHIRKATGEINKFNVQDIVRIIDNRYPISISEEAVDKFFADMGANTLSDEANKMIGWEFTPSSLIKFDQQTVTAAIRASLMLSFAQVIQFYPEWGSDEGFEYKMNFRKEWNSLLARSQQPDFSDNDIAGLAGTSNLWDVFSQNPGFRGEILVSGMAVAASRSASSGVISTAVKSRLKGFLSSLAASLFIAGSYVPDGMSAEIYETVRGPNAIPTLNVSIKPGDTWKKIIEDYLQEPLENFGDPEIILKTSFALAQKENPALSSELKPGTWDFHSVMEYLYVLQTIRNSDFVYIDKVKSDTTTIPLYAILQSPGKETVNESVRAYSLGEEGIVLDMRKIADYGKEIKRKSETPANDYYRLMGAVLAGMNEDKIIEFLLKDIAHHEVIHSVVHDHLFKAAVDVWQDPILSQKWRDHPDYGRMVQEIPAYLGQVALSSRPKFVLTRMLFAGVSDYDYYTTQHKFVGQLLAPIFEKELNLGKLTDEAGIVKFLDTVSDDQLRSAARQAFKTIMGQELPQVGEVNIPSRVIKKATAASSAILNSEGKGLEALLNENVNYRERETLEQLLTPGSSADEIARMGVDQLNTEILKGIEAGAFGGWLFAKHMDMLRKKGVVGLLDILTLAQVEAKDNKFLIDDFIVPLILANQPDSLIYLALSSEQRMAFERTREVVREVFVRLGMDQDFMDLLFSGVTTPDVIDTAMNQVLNSEAFTQRISPVIDAIVESINQQKQPMPQAVTAFVSIILRNAYLMESKEEPWFESIILPGQRNKVNVWNAPYQVTNFVMDELVSYEPQEFKAIGIHQQDMDGANAVLTFDDKFVQAINNKLPDVKAVFMDVASGFLGDSSASSGVVLAKAENVMIVDGKGFHGRTAAAMARMKNRYPQFEIFLTYQSRGDLRRAQMEGYLKTMFLQIPQATVIVEIEGVEGYEQNLELQSEAQEALEAVKVILATDFSGSDRNPFASSAVNIDEQKYGGIDFDPSKLNLQIKRDGRGVPLPLPQQNLENININGLYPVIINIMPVNTQTLPILGQLSVQPDVALSKG